MSRERITLSGRIGLLPEYKKDKDYVLFKINTATNGEARWWKIIVYGKMEDFPLFKQFKLGDLVTVFGKPEFQAWTKVNKKGNDVQVNNNAHIFMSRNCITKIEDIYLN